MQSVVILMHTCYLRTFSNSAEGTFKYRSAYKGSKSKLATSLSSDEIQSPPPGYAAPVLCQTQQCIIALTWHNKKVTVVVY